MADDLKPLPVANDAALEQIDNLGSDYRSTDFDGALKKSTADAKSKALSDFSGAQPTATEPASEHSGSVDDDALKAAVTAEPIVDAVAESTSTDVVKPAATKKPEPAAAAAAEPAKPAEPAQPAPKSYDPAEKFALADGVEVTREQVAQSLRERQQWGQAAQTFTEVFRCTPEQAKQFWAPYVERLISEPKLGAHIDDAIATFDNAAKLAYIEKCSKHYDEQSPAAAQPAARPQPAAIPPELARELNEARAFRAQFEQQNAAQQVAKEKSDLVSQHPQLADEALMQIVAQRTFAVLGEQQRTGAPMTYTMRDAARDLKAVIDKWGSPAQPAAPAAKVPALNTSSGASASTRTPVDMKSRKFASADEAVADWDRNVAGALGFK